MAMSTGPVITRMMSESMIAAPNRGQKPTYSSWSSCISNPLWLRADPPGQAMLPRQPPEVDRHADTEERTGQDGGRDRDPSRDPLPRPRDQPHQQAPEDAEEAAHQQHGLPEAPERRGRHRPPHAPE